MQKLTHTVSKEKLLSITFPKNSEMSFILVDIKAYLEDLKRDIQLMEDGEDWHKCRITSVWDSTDPKEGLRRMKGFNSEYGLIMLDDEGMDPECYLHTLNKSEMQAMAELKPYELDPKASEYCSKLAEICNDSVASVAVDVQPAVPSKFSKSILKSDIELDLC